MSSCTKVISKDCNVFNVVNESYFKKLKLEDVEVNFSQKLKMFFLLKSGLAGSSIKITLYKIICISFSDCFSDQQSV